MKYILYCSLLLVVLCLSDCKISLAVQTTAPLASTLTLEKLVAKDISENRNQLSTMEDEVYLFVYHVRNQSVIYSWQSPLWLFTAEQSQQVLSLHLNNINPQDEFTFFLLELDNDTLASEVKDQLLGWVQSEGFPASFDALEADNSFGHDDLLGMQSFSFQQMTNQSPVVFSGLQLFDRFRYELHFKI